MSKFNFNINIDNSERNLLSKSDYNSITLKKLIEHIVDLGLPSGTLWYKYNLDVNPNLLSKEEDWYGKYYAWGELQGNKNCYDNNCYKYANGLQNKLTKYCPSNKSGCWHGLNNPDNLTLLLPEDDTAYQNKKLYNFKFYIPTKELCEELKNYTSNYWVNNYNPNKTIHNQEDDRGIIGLNGRVFVGKNEKQLFIPAAGFRNGSRIYGVGSSCSLWSSSLCLDEPYRAYYLYIDDSDNI